MNLTTALRYLDQHTNLEATAGRAEGLSLDRMQRLVSVLGDPQAAYPVIHITGTNGKGSVGPHGHRAAGAPPACRSAPTPARTSRPSTSASPATASPSATTSSARPSASVAAVEELAGITPSYFEILTAAAFLWFADVAVDVAVIEVGMLGRYDATNVVDAAVSVLTNVGQDHTDGAGAWRAGDRRREGRAS